MTKNILQSVYVPEKSAPRLAFNSSRRPTIVVKVC